MEEKKNENISNTENINNSVNNKEQNINDENYKILKNNIPIYNEEAFMFFSDNIDEDEPKYFIYQEEAYYIGGKDKDYILMSDIFVDKNESELINWNKLIKRVDFNNHRIFTKDQQVITESER
ncbi:MAG: hypothetical protein HFJ25_00115 [Clostridia bacterium]|nr:hypothetical protein [Clostridia bacterium]